MSEVKEGECLPDHENKVKGCLFSKFAKPKRLLDVGISLFQVKLVALVSPRTMAWFALFVACLEITVAA